MSFVHLVAAVFGLLGILVILWDTFETIVVPKTVQRRIRISTLYSNVIWNLWHRMADRLPEGGLRTAVLGSFGPLAILFLFVVWASLLVIGFALVHWGLMDMGVEASLPEYLYFSGVTFFTLGYGDMTSSTAAGRFVSVAEAGTGYAFLAVVIAFVPTFYQAFSRRERFIVMMDSRAGSNPTSGELLRRYADAGSMPALASWLKDAEGWCAEQLENYLSYPILAYYRSQHDDQSWLAAMTAVLDTCALILSASSAPSPPAPSPEGSGEQWQNELLFQARSTFAMGRHVVVDLAYLLDEAPAEEPPSRMTPQDEKRLCAILQEAFGAVNRDLFERLSEHRMKYEPYLVGLARDMHYVLPAWTPLEHEEDNWERSAWDVEKHF
jgi:voltage-gated potassium channel Kch